MLKKIALLAAVASSFAVGVPLQATAEDYQYTACMLNAGCAWVPGDGIVEGHWECPNPQAFMDCVQM